jgi:hypothetical protein
MQLKLDVKTLIIGIAVGVLITATLGFNGGSADKADYGIAVENHGYVLVRTANGSFYTVNVDKSTAERVTDQSRGARDRAFSFTPPSRDTRTPRGY